MSGLDLNAMPVESFMKDEPMDVETTSGPVTPLPAPTEPAVQLSQTSELQQSSEEIGKSETSSQDSAQKKRGRPPLPAEQQKIPKKRGRPPKIREPELGFSDSEGDNRDTRKSSDTLPNTSTEATETTVPAVPTPPVKRGRGRPRKGEIVIKPEAKIPKKRGRPPKSASTMSEDEQRKKLKSDAKYKSDKQKFRNKDWKAKPSLRASTSDQKLRADFDPRFPHKINLSVGADQSTGPGFFSVTTIKCTLSPPEIQKAYQAGTEKLGFDFQKETCTSEVNCSLSASLFQKLVAAGIPVLDDDEETNDAAFELTLESYREIWLHIARLGNPQLNWLVADLEAMPIGGHGLFHDLVQKEVL